MSAHGQTKVSGLTSFTLGAGLALAASVTATASCASGGSGASGTSGASSAPGQGGANGHSGATVSAPADSTTTAAASAPDITVQRTGGFAGAKDTVDLAPHGSWTATDKSGARRTGELTPDQATRITTLAADPRLTAEAARSRPPTRCRDAYSYVLTVGAVRVAFVDCPADPDQPAASLTLTKQVLRFTIQPAR
ncbi:hypothetical protein KGQ19_14885 [Catenulispora sp. NL8]|uniref:Lipoprotein n=1 Tax=Catenulispora pinistramenti TaxID=2705254 RepID=A0ABS5KQ48_9ACTN|nr:hypothetical protein [Catenulispora pinistramenti]MBS2548151.1 hypothetical protein [Catenulispora pinistramenti]